MSAWTSWSRWCWGEIRRLTKFASQFEDEFVKAVIGHSQQAEATDRKLKEKELKALQARDEELDGLFERIYEDNVSGKLSDDRFARMSRRYEEEQKELAEKIKALRAEIDKQNSQVHDHGYVHLPGPQIHPRPQANAQNAQRAHRENRGIQRREGRWGVGATAPYPL